MNNDKERPEGERIYPHFPKASHLTNDARNTILSKLREALNECANNDDYDAILFVVTLMRKTHDET